MKRVGICGRLGASVVTGAALLGAFTAAAQSPIAVGADATWSQEDAAFRMPPEIAGFARTAMVDYGDQRLDVSGTYQDPQTQTTATLYLFRAPLPDVSVWHDRAIASIRPHATLGTPVHSAAVTAAFAPPGAGDVKSGLRTVLPLTGSAFRSTGVALFPHGDWLVKVRMSSRTLDPAQLTGRLDTFVAALSYEPRGAPRAVARMADCPAGLAFANAPRADPPNLAAQLVLSLLSDSVGKNASETAIEAEAIQPVPFCRDPSSQPAFGVYRQAGTDDSILLALNDAGISATVRRQPAPEFLEGTAASDYLIQLSTPYGSDIYRGFRSLPAPAQVMQVLQGERPVSSVSYDATGGSTISVTPP